jgi:hypothetical protein
LLIGIILALVFVALVFMLEITKGFTLTKVLSLLLGGGVFYSVLYNVSFNTDWLGYELMFDGELEGTDILFNSMVVYAKAVGLKYDFIYKTHIVLMGIGFLYFVSRFSWSMIFAIISTYLLFQIVPVSNQIRYYLAYIATMLALYNLVVTKNRLNFILFAIFSLLSHTGVVLIYPFLLIYQRLNANQYFTIMFLASLIFGAFVFVFYNISLVVFSRFANYFSEDGVSTFFGGLFNNGIWIFWSFYLVWINRRLSREDDDALQEDNQYQFLYKLSMYPVLFYPISFFIQIASHRYIIASLLVWLIFIFYTLRYESTVGRQMWALSRFVLLVVISFVYFYLLPDYLLPKADTNPLLEIVLSNPVLLYFVL